MRTIIFTSGTSVFGNLARHGFDPRSAAITAQVNRQFLERLGDQANELSAEVGTLSALGAGAGDQAILLTTDSALGRAAAALVKHITEIHLGVEVTVTTIEGLTLDAADEFRRRGLPALVDHIDSAVAEARSSGREPVISVGAGINAVVPYTAVYAMLRRVPICYRFQQTTQIIHLPPLPLAFDHDALQQAARVLAKFERDAILPQHEVRAALGAEFSALEGLFEPVDGDDLTLSAFGLLLLSDLRQASEAQVFLSPGARRALDSADGVGREQFTFMLSRVRNPMWRAMKRHAFPRTDLAVFKSGSTGQRLAGWIAGHTIYVAELYEHAEYERALPNRRIANYDPAAFIPWVPDEDVPLDQPTDEQQEIERLVASARRATARAEADVTVALAAATERETELAAARQSLAELERLRLDLAAQRETARALAAERDARANLGLWERLRWALRPRTPS